jgi:hypothetical protein
LRRGGAIKISLLFAAALLIASPGNAGRIWLEGEWEDYVAHQYSDADIAIVARVISSVPKVIEESDSPGTDGWTYRRLRQAVTYRVRIDSVFKGTWADTVIAFEGAPFTQRSRWKRVRPSDSLYVVEVQGPADGQENTPLSEQERYVLFLKEDNSTYLYIFAARPDERVFTILRNATSKAPQDCPGS